MKLYRIAACCAVLLAGPVLEAQTPSANKSSSAVPKENFLRRFSLGVKLSVWAMHSVGHDVQNTSSTNPTTATKFETDGRSQKLGGGVTAEFAATRNVSVTADYIYHRFAYRMDTTTTVTTTDSTGQSINSTTLSTERTHAHYWDLPILARYYWMERREGKLRMFFEVGGVMRHATTVRTYIDTTSPNGTVTSTNTPKALQHSSIRGVTAGWGVKLIDDFGIRMIPGVRYTRWLADTWNPLPEKTKRNQLEALVAFTF